MSFKNYVLSLLFFTLLFPVTCISGNNPAQKDFFPDIKGFTKSGGPVSYKPETLFEYMDGAADLYLIFDFAGLNLQIYKDKQGNTITVEIYDQQNVNNSFGIYSQERPYECEYLPIGTQANYMEGFLNFYQNKYYVKISGYNLGIKDKELLTSTGKKISDLLGGSTLPPKMLKAFPEDGKIKNKEEYIARDFLGYPFFKRVFTAEYENSGAAFKLFIIEEPDSASLVNSVNEYKKQAGLKQDILDGKIHEIEDPYQGKLFITVSGDYIVGILNTDDAKIDPDIIKQTISNLK